MRLADRFRCDCESLIRHTLYEKDYLFGKQGAWATHFLTQTLDKVRTEMSRHVLAYNLKRMISIVGLGPLMAAIRT